MKELGKIIKERRKSLKVNQLELSKLAGVGINTLVAIERGEGNPKLATAFHWSWLKCGKMYKIASIICLF